MQADSDEPPTQDGVGFIAAESGKLPDENEEREGQQTVADGAGEG